MAQLHLKLNNHQLLTLHLPTSWFVAPSGGGKAFIHAGASASGTKYVKNILGKWDLGKWLAGKEQPHFY